MKTTKPRLEPTYFEPRRRERQGDIRAASASSATTPRSRTYQVVTNIADEATPVRRGLALRSYGQIFVRSVARLVARIWNSARAADERRAALRELQALGDRQLRDMGIARSDFTAIVNGTYSRDTTRVAGLTNRPR